jgi:hypothetical protein
MLYYHQGTQSETHYACWIRLSFLILHRTSWNMSFWEISHTQPAVHIDVSQIWPYPPSLEWRHHVLLSSISHSRVYKLNSFFLQVKCYAPWLYFSVYLSCIFFEGFRQVADFWLSMDVPFTILALNYVKPGLGSKQRDPLMSNVHYHRNYIWLFHECWIYRWYLLHTCAQNYCTMEFLKVSLLCWASEK